MTICNVVADAGWYRALTDLGSFIAGILALTAGFIAYRGARGQANKASADAKLQIAAVRGQTAVSTQNQQKLSDFIVIAIFAEVRAVQSALQGVQPIEMHLPLIAVG